MTNSILISQDVLSESLTDKLSSEITERNLKENDEFLVVDGIAILGRITSGKIMVERIITKIL